MRTITINTQYSFTLPPIIPIPETTMHSDTLNLLAQINTENFHLLVSHSNMKMKMLNNFGNREMQKSQCNNLITGMGDENSPGMENMPGHS